MTTTSPPFAYDDLPDLVTRMTGDEKHAPSSSSTLDVLWVLYHHVLNVSPDRVDDPGRDRFFLSKGHGPMAFYAVLAAHGFFPADWLDTAMAFDSPLGGHPDRSLVPGVEIASGSLGHGLPMAVGTCLALRSRGSGAHVHVLVGDAELDEGSNDEAIAFAGARGLENLTVVAIDNQSSTHGRPGRLVARFALEGWDAGEVDGHDHSAIRDALLARPGRPTFVSARVERKTA
ncbi:thiamine pyrophosphate-dependent enzyme [Williamsia deligens]|uniref:Transketolase n=1 Tax=Williamsia deligens TaxID=321325 RepID=A0ABW3G225_9NOCA|nr:transketolase [Williamsia deligens]MCP2194954.1 transketolase [Williamsia deligens]